MKSYYKGKLVSKYNIYDIDKLNFDTLSIKKKDVLRVINLYSNEKIIGAIKEITNNTIFLEMISKYALSYESEEYSLETYAKSFVGKVSYNRYIQNKQILDSVTNNLIASNNKIINISFYTYTNDYGDCYFYQKGYNNFNFEKVSNSVIQSVLFDFENFFSYNNNLLGIEVTETGQVIVIPFVNKGKYVGDLRLMLCN